MQSKILQRMRQVLTEKTVYPYLMKNAKARLNQMRDTVAVAGMPEKPLINLGGKMWALFPWTGSYSFLALERLIRIKCGKKLNIRGFNSSRPYFMEFSMDASEDEFFEVLSQEANKDFAPLELLFPNEVPVFDKYDEFLPDELVKKEFAYSILDTKEMRNCVNQMVQKKV